MSSLLILTPFSSEDVTCKFDLEVFAGDADDLSESDKLPWLETEDDVLTCSTLKGRLLKTASA